MIEPPSLKFDYIHVKKQRKMSDKDFAKLMDIAQERIEAARTMTKKEAIATLNRAGILTKKGEFTKHYPTLKALKKGK